MIGKKACFTSNPSDKIVIVFNVHSQPNNTTNTMMPIQMATSHDIDTGIANDKTPSGNKTIEFLRYVLLNVDFISPKRPKRSMKAHNLINIIGWQF